MSRQELRIKIKGSLGWLRGTIRDRRLHFLLALLIDGNSGQEIEMPAECTRKLN